MQSNRNNWMCMSIGFLVLSLFYVEVMHHWWAWDDFHLLVVIQKHSWWEYFFDRSFYERSKVLFTPMEYIFYQVNHLIFGLRPHGFYLFNLICLLGVFFFTAKILAFRCGVFWSWIGAVFVCLLAPICTVVHQIQCVHYLAGLLFLCICIYLYIRSVYDRKLWKSLLGGIFFMLACLCKEIYITIPVVLILFFKYDRGLLKYWVVFPLVSVIYLLWRFWVLDSILQGFGIAYGLLDLLILPVTLTSAILGGSWLTIGFLLLFLAVILTLVAGNYRILIVLVVAYLTLLIPLHTVAYRLHASDRALTLLAWSLGVCIIYTLSQWSKVGRIPQTLSMLTLIAFCIGGLKTTLDVRDRLMVAKSRFEAVGRFMLEEGTSGDLLFLPGPTYRAREASELRSILYGEESPSLLYDPIQLDLFDLETKTIWFLDGKSSSIVRFSDDLQSFQDAWIRRTREAPLSIRMTKYPTGIHWDFGPYPGTNYSVILLKRSFAFNNVYREGIYSAPIGPMTFLIRYQSPEGWITYSDTLQWNNVENEILTWSRAD